MKNRTLLVDSPYLLRRSFEGAKNVYTPSFGHIGGLYSFLTTVRMLVKDHRINKVVLMWDGENSGKQRYFIDRNYKANRTTKEWQYKIQLNEYELKREKEKEVSLLKQKKRIQAYAEELFLRQIEVDEIEADDLIAEYCLKYNNKEEIFIYTNDRDFSQLLDLNINIIFGNIGEPVNKINYMMHFEHFYRNALTVKIIEGDVADNIEGISNVGEKTLLKYFPELKYKHLSVNDIYKGAIKINKQRLSENKKPLKALENIVNGTKRLKTNFELINLREPLLNQEAIDELEQLEMPLSPDGRGSKYLFEMMKEDEFLTVYSGTFPNYVEPFYTIIMQEKERYKEYLKSL